MQARGASKKTWGRLNNETQNERKHGELFELSLGREEAGSVARVPIGVH